MRLIIKLKHILGMEGQFNVKAPEIPSIGDIIVWSRGGKNTRYKVEQREWFISKWGENREEMSINQIVVSKVKVKKTPKKNYPEEVPVIRKEDIE